MVEDCYLDVHGIPLHFLKWGRRENPPVLLLHGTSGHAHVWDSLAQSLEDEWYVVALDQRGHGESGWANPPAYRANDYMADISTLVESQEFSRLVVLGHSMGAQHAILTAARMPERVAGLVVVEVEAKVPDYQVKFLRAAGANPHSEFRSLGEMVEKERKVMSKVPVEVVEHVVRWNAKHVDNGFTYKFDRTTLAHFDKYDSTSLLGYIKCPTLVVRGADSLIVSREAALEMRRRIPTSEFAEIAGGTHFVFLEKPEAFNRTVAGFLQRIECLSYQP